MIMKIFKKSDKSRIKLDLNFESSYWWLRSARTYVLTGFFIAGINWNGCVRIFYTYGYSDTGLAPVCII